MKKKSNGKKKRSNGNGSRNTTKPRAVPKKKSPLRLTPKKGTADYA